MSYWKKKPAGAPNKMKILAIFSTTLIEHSSLLEKYYIVYSKSIVMAIIRKVGSVWINMVQEWFKDFFFSFISAVICNCGPYSVDDLYYVSTVFMPGISLDRKCRLNMMQHKSMVE